jgi:hypothetical protein
MGKFLPQKGARVAKMKKVFLRFLCLLAADRFAFSSGFIFL